MTGLAAIASVTLAASPATGAEVDFFAPVRLDCNLTQHRRNSQLEATSEKETILFVEGDRPLDMEQQVIILKTLEDGRSWVETAHASARPDGGPFVGSITFSDGNDTLLNSYTGGSPVNYVRPFVLTDGAGSGTIDGQCQITMESKQ